MRRCVVTVVVLLTGIVASPAAACHDTNPARRWYAGYQKLQSGNQTISGAITENYPARTVSGPAGAVVNGWLGLDNNAATFNAFAWMQGGNYDDGSYTWAYIEHKPAGASVSTYTWGQIAVPGTTTSFQVTASGSVMYGYINGTLYRGADVLAAPTKRVFIGEARPSTSHTNCSDYSFTFASMSDSVQTWTVRRDSPWTTGYLSADYRSFRAYLPGGGPTLRTVTKPTPDLEAFLRSQLPIGRTETGLVYADA